MSVFYIPTVDTVFSVEVGGNETQFTLRELQPNQAYRLRIAAGTGIGFGVPSEWAQHQTLAHFNHSDSSMGKGKTVLICKIEDNGIYIVKYNSII